MWRYVGEHEGESLFLVVEEAGAMQVWPGKLTIEGGEIGLEMNQDGGPLIDFVMDEGTGRVGSYQSDDLAEFAQKLRVKLTEEGWGMAGVPEEKRPKEE